MNRRLMIRAADVHRFVDMLAEEAQQEAEENRFALDALRSEWRVLVSENEELRKQIVEMTRRNQVVENT